MSGSLKTSIGSAKLPLGSMGARGRIFNKHSDYRLPEDGTIMCHFELGYKLTFSAIVSWLLSVLPDIIGSSQPEGPAGRMRKKGKLKSWNDEKGFGFILPPDGGKDVFLHISAFRNRNRRPEAGQLVSYAVTTGKDGRTRATNATFPGDRLPIQAPRQTSSALIMFAVMFLVAVALLVAISKLPVIVLCVYLALSLLTLMMYAMDKSAAKEGAWRTPEKALHWLSIAGGWPGALIAQQKLRHKSKKGNFITVFWMTVAINCIAFGWLFSSDGSALLQQWLPAMIRWA